jgi:hypothetical protein
VPESRSSLPTRKDSKVQDRGVEDRQIMGYREGKSSSKDNREGGGPIRCYKEVRGSRRVRISRNSREQEQSKEE